MPLAYQNPKAKSGFGDIFYVRESNGSYSIIEPKAILKRDGNALYIKHQGLIKALDIRSGYIFFEGGQKDQRLDYFLRALDDAAQRKSFHLFNKVKLQEYGLSPRYEQPQYPKFEGKTSIGSGNVTGTTFGISKNSGRNTPNVSAASMAGKVSVLELAKYRTPNEQAAIDARKLKDTIIDQRGNLADIRKMRTKILELNQDLIRRRAKATTIEQKQQITEKYKREVREFFQRENNYVALFRKTSPEARQYNKTQIVELALANFQNFPVPAPKLSITQTTSTKRAKRSGNQPTGKQVDMSKALNQIRLLHDQYTNTKAANLEKLKDARTKYARESLQWSMDDDAHKFSLRLNTLANDYREASLSQESNNEVLRKALALKTNK